MLFQRRFHLGLECGEITLTFRRWVRPQVRVGGRYRCPPIGLLEVDAVERVPVGRIREAEARRAGFSDRAELVAFLARGSRVPLRDTDEVFRVALHFSGPDTAPDPGADATLAEADASALRERLDRMDRLSGHGPWTERALDLIERHPRVRAAALAERLGRDTRSFKADVRKLKRLGLTRSFEVGYELSPRGRAYRAWSRPPGSAARRAARPSRSARPR
jgi:hypothetical protein